MGSPVGYLLSNNNNNNLNSFGRAVTLNRNSNDFSDEGLEREIAFAVKSFEN